MSDGLTRVALDSVLLFGPMRKRESPVWEYVNRTGIRAVVSTYVFEEVYSYAETAEQVAALLSFVARCEVFASTPTAKLPAGVEIPDPNDHPVLQDAVRSKCDVLVTRDKDFDKLLGTTVGGVTVESDRSFRRSFAAGHS